MAQDALVFCLLGGQLRPCWSLRAVEVCSHLVSSPVTADRLGEWRQRQQKVQLQGTQACKTLTLSRAVCIDSD